MTLYPLLTAPYFCRTPWGGSMLRDAFLKDAPEQTGESYEVSVLPDMGCAVRNGAHAGISLGRMAELWRTVLTGTAGEFPLLLKLLDARERAEFAPGGGKAWVVLNCDAGAKLSVGTAEIEARPGGVYDIPAGQAHALGANMQVYEVGGADDAEPGEARTDMLRGVTSLCRGGSRTYYISHPGLEFCRLNVSGAMPVSDGRMLLLTPLGSCALRWGEGEELELAPFDSVVIPAALEDATLVSDDCKVLMASLPRRDALRAELGYRAEGVAGLL